MLKWILKKQDGNVWTKLNFPRIGTSGGSYWTCWTFGFHKIFGIS